MSCFCFLTPVSISSPRDRPPTGSCLTAVAAAAASASGVAATARATDAPTPAFAFNLGINAIEYLKDQALNTLLPKLQHLALPDVSGNPKVCSKVSVGFYSMACFSALILRYPPCFCQTPSLLINTPIFCSALPSHGPCHIVTSRHN
jgi:hypothetical protein